MRAFIQWLIRNRKMVLTVGGLAVEYVPKTYILIREKYKKWKKKKKE